MRALEEVREAEERRMDSRFAMLCCVIANANRNPKQRPYRIQDFMPRQRNKPTTREELEAKIRAFCDTARAIQEGERRAQSNA